MAKNINGLGNGHAEGRAPDPFALTATGSTATLPRTIEPLDWQQIKNDILAGLDVIAEYRALGVEFTRDRPDSKGRVECHAKGRTDEVPSAFVNAETGVYHDSGGAGESLGFFDFALKHGDFGRWIDVLRHYAKVADVPLGAVPTHGKGDIREAVYPYRDAAGEVRYAVFRYRTPTGKKRFTQHPPDGRGGWKYGSGCMDGVEPLPYRLPELLASAAADDVVFVVEGEKDADRLAALGLTATTNHQGAQSTDRTWPKFLDHFRGRAVAVVADNDDGGRKHAIKVCAYLKPVARSVKLLELDGLPPKGDASDWLDLGHDADHLARLAAEAPEWDPAAEGLSPTNPAEDLTRDASVVDLRRYISGTAWLWPGWIPSAALTLLAAEGGTGKTRFCFDLHRRIFNGLDWPDGAAMPMLEYPRVLWVVADNQHQEMCDLPTEFGVPDDAVMLNAQAGDPFGGTSLQTADELADLEARIARVRPTLVIIDTITNTGDYKSQDSSDAKRQYKPLQEIAVRQGVPILCVTHLNAGGKVLGRRATEKVRVVIQMDQPDKEGQPNRRKLWVEKSKALRPPPLGVTMHDGGNDYDGDPPQAPAEPGRVGGATHGPPPAKTRECMAWLERRLGMGEARVSVLRTEAEGLGFSAPVIYKARDLLKVQETERDGRKWWALHTNGAANGVPF